MDIEGCSASCSTEWQMIPTASAICYELTLDGEPCDVIIKAGGVEFKAHQKILRGCSPYFHALFTWYLNSSDKMYDIPGVSADIMKLILDYAYSRTVPISSDNVEDLFIATDYLNILCLVQLCSEFLQSQLCLENCIGIYIFTEHYHCPDLHLAALQYLLDNLEDVIDTSDELPDLSMADIKAYFIESCLVTDITDMR